jgi:hypothetical protein
MIDDGLKGLIIFFTKGFRFFSFLSFADIGGERLIKEYGSPGVHGADFVPAQTDGKWIHSATLPGNCNIGTLPSESVLDIISS